MNIREIREFYSLADIALFNIYLCTLNLSFGWLFDLRHDLQEMYISIHDFYVAANKEGKSLQWTRKGKKPKHESKKDNLGNMLKLNIQMR